MKKTIIRVLAAALCLAMLIPLSGCSSIERILLLTMDDTQKGEYIVGKADRNMEKRKSYQHDITAEFSGNIEGNDFKVTSRENGIFANIGEKDYACYITNETVTSLNNGQTTSVEITTEGYQNGKMFYTSQSEGKTRKLWSAISADDYQAHVESMNDDNDIEESDAEKCVYSENDDGSITLIYTDFNEKALEELSTYLVNGVMSVVAPGYIIDDVELEVCISSDYYYESAHLRLYFTGTNGADEEAPVYTVTTEYSDPYRNESVDPINLSEYTEVDDLRYLDRYDEGLLDVISLNEGEFKLSLNYNVSGGGLNQINSETDSISFTRNNGKVRYTLETVIDGSKYTVEYKNDVEKIYVLQMGQKELVSSTAKTQAEAEVYFRSLVDPAGFSMSDVVGLTVHEGGCIIELDPESDATVQAVIAQYGGSFEEGTKTLTVRFTEDGALKSVKTTLEVTMLINYGSSEMNIVQTYENDFT